MHTCDDMHSNNAVLTDPGCSGILSFPVTLSLKFKCS